MAKINKKEKNMSIELSLFDSIASESLKIIPDIGEIALDSVLEDGVLKEIPIINTLLGFVKVGLNIRDRLFLRKLLLFLVELEKVPLKERKQFIEKLNDKPDFKRKIGEKLILLIDRLDDIEKSEIIARLFGSYLKEEIDYATFTGLAMTVDRASLYDLTSLARYVLNRTSMQNSCEARLASAGLMSIESIGGTGIDMYAKGLFNYSVSEDGKLLSEIAFIHLKKVKS